MKKTKLTRSLSLVLASVLIAAMALFATGCSDKKKTDETSKVQASESVATATTGDVKKMGEGQKQFNFNVTGTDGKETKFDIHTDKGTVGEALLEQNLIAGDKGDYGLYVKTVNGETVDFNDGGKYWAFYVNDSFAEKGVDQTEIAEGATYSFKVQK